MINSLNFFKELHLELAYRMVHLLQTRNYAVIAKFDKNQKQLINVQDLKFVREPFLLRGFDQIK